MKPVKSLFNDLFSLLFPNNCAACNRTLVKGEKVLCLFCLNELPKTGFHQIEENRAAQVFWGRINTEKVAAYFFYQKQSKYQQLIHQLKYKGRQDIGVYLGEIYAVELQRNNFFDDIDCLIAVPLHKKKLRKRGYNQAECIVNGIVNKTGTKLIKDSLLRVKYHESQTSKSRTERYENVKDDFRLNKPEQLKGRHCLLVDDVITTGATLEACAKQILKVENCKLSILSLAFAQ